MVNFMTRNRRPVAIRNPISYKPRNSTADAVDETAEKAFARQKRGRTSLIRTSVRGLLELQDDLKRKNLLGD